jgi:hypothetical protein
MEPGGAPGKIPAGYRLSRSGRLVRATGGNKYRARRTLGFDGRTYDSAAEAGEAARLEGERHAGTIVSAIPQVSIPCGTADDGKDQRLRVDWLVIHELRPDGTFVAEFLDKKGVDTATGRAKRGAVKALYGVPVQLC